MRKFCKRLLAGVLALGLSAAVLLPVEAMDYSGSESYMSGRYYQALKEVELTGDSRTDIVNIALSQVGYQESNSAKKLSGETKGDYNYTEYGRWYGVQAAWCGIFVSWCAAQAGVDTDVVPKQGHVPSILQWFKKQDQAYRRRDVVNGKYTPQPGDIIFFHYGKSNVATDHVGLVVGYEDGMIYTVEGNSNSNGGAYIGGWVNYKSYKVNDGTIAYICSPDYESNATQIQMDKLREAVYGLVSGNTRYDQITELFGRGMAIGRGQWFGAEAQALLMKIREADPRGFAVLDTAGIGYDLDNADWSSYMVSADSEKAACLSLILGSRVGVRVQDAQMNERLKQYMLAVKDMGVKDVKGQMVCVALYHLGGVETVSAVLSSISGAYTGESMISAMKAPEFAPLRRGCRMVWNSVCV
jgi:hypothetical protein